MATRAALHNPDMVAGGDYFSVADPMIPIESRIGGKIENSSIGGQWVSRVSRLDLHAAEQIRNRCPSLSATLDICVSSPTNPGQPVGPQGSVPT